MSRTACRLSIYFGERSRSAGAPLAEALFSSLAEHGVGHAVLLRTEEGFGPRHGLQSSDRLSLSEDLPLVLVAMGDADGANEVAVEARGLLDEGLVTVERTRVCGDARPSASSGPSGHGRITVWTDRGSRVDGSPGYEVLTESLRENGADAAVALLGIDGLAFARRRRAGFFSANRRVPMIVTAVGESRALERGWSQVAGRLPGALAEICPVEVLPADGHSGWTDGPDPVGMRRLSIYGSGLADGAENHRQGLVRRLRRAGAPGATAFHAVFGFAGKDRPHGESLRTLRRRVPVVTEVVHTGGGHGLWLSEVEAVRGPSCVVVAQQIEKVSRADDRA